MQPSRHDTTQSSPHAPLKTQHTHILPSSPPDAGAPQPSRPHLLLGGAVLVLVGELAHHAQRVAARDDGGLVDGRCSARVECDHGVAALVVGGEAAGLGGLGEGAARREGEGGGGRGEGEGEGGGRVCEYVSM
jgi:hypothetical protein